jgi:hypothetical protein
MQSLSTANVAGYFAASVGIIDEIGILLIDGSHTGSGVVAYSIQVVSHVIAQFANIIQKPKAPSGSCQL